MFSGTAQNAVLGRNLMGCSSIFQSCERLWCSRQWYRYELYAWIFCLLHQALSWPKVLCNLHSGWDSAARHWLKVGRLLCPSCALAAARPAAPRGGGCWAGTCKLSFGICLFFPPPLPPTSTLLLFLVHLVKLLWDKSVVKGWESRAKRLRSVPFLVPWQSLCRHCSSLNIFGCSCDSMKQT